VQARFAEWEVRADWVRRIGLYVGESSSAYYDPPTYLRTRCRTDDESSRHDKSSELHTLVDESRTSLLLLPLAHHSRSALSELEAISHLQRSLHARQKTSLRWERLDR
jgi:hypothetical protein